MPTGLRRHIPLIRPNVGAEELEQVRKVLQSGWLSQGPMVKEFEDAVARYVGAPHTLATTSCTTALSLALQSCGIPPGSEVVVPDFTFPATGNVVFLHGCMPVITDVSLDTMALEAGELAKAITKRTSAVIVVHPFGHPADMGPIRDLAERKGIKVIEDAATAFGTKYKGTRIGGEGEAVCFSFHPRKLLTTGEGGALVTQDERVADRAASLRNHGEIDTPRRKRFVVPGSNYRMSDLQAGVGLAQLRKFDSFVKERRSQAKLYTCLLEESGLDLTPPVEEKWAFSTYQSYVIHLGRRFGVSRDHCIRKMKKEHSIETQIGTYSMHMEPSFAKAVRVGSLKNGEELFRTTLTLPLYHGLTESDQQRVVESLAASAGAWQ